MHTGSYQKQNFQSWDYFSEAPTHQKCLIISSQIKGILSCLYVCCISCTNSMEQSFPSQAKSLSYSRNTLQSVRLPPVTTGLYSERDKSSPNQTPYLITFQFNTILSSMHMPLKWPASSCSFSTSVFISHLSHVCWLVHLKVEPTLSARLSDSI
jgi:hypothetical protein